MALALEFYRSAPMYLGTRTLGSKAPGLVTAGLAPLRLVTQKDPEPKREGWARVKPRLSGICGSDLHEYYDGPELAAPDCRPKDETVPGPHSRVPKDWADQLRRRDA